MPISRKRAREEEAAIAAATAASTANVTSSSPASVSRSRSKSNAPAAQSQEKSMLQKIRDMWEFSSLMQYIFTFGKLVKIDEGIDIEDLETECLRPGPSPRLAEIGLCLLKWVSSHRGLTYELFDEYTRRQYVAKTPSRNPFGTDEEPNKFSEFDVFTKIRVLHQLSIWTFHNPDRIREKMAEQTEREQTEWRCEELGYDADDRQYYVLDDNRLYRRTEPPLPPAPRAKPKSNSKKGKALARAAKRRKLSMTDDSEIKEEEEQQDDGIKKHPEGTDQGYKWECLAVTLDEYNAFIDKIRKTKDPNEQILRDRLLEGVVPIIERQAARQQRKMQQHERELAALEKMATAKRSSRLAGKQERERQEREEADAERRRQEELKEAKKSMEQQKKMERERQNRMQTREQRIKEREHKRILHEEDLRKIEEEKEKLESGEGRVSGRRLKADLEKVQKDLEELEEDEDWVFDCSGCGIHGQNLDDGKHSIACEKCNVWQHSKCLGIKQADAENDDFEFVCRDCQQKEEDAKQAKLTPLKKIHIKPRTSPNQDTTSPIKHDQSSEKKRKSSDGIEVQVKKLKTDHSPSAAINGSGHSAMKNPLNGPMLPPQGTFQINGYGHSPQKQSPSSTGTASQTTTPRLNQPSNGANGHSSIPNQPAFATKASSLQNKPAALKNVSSSPVQAKASPIQNRPSMSPTQGNHDVGHLAGFPASASMHSPYVAHGSYTPSSNRQSSNGQSNANGTANLQSPFSSFGATPTPSKAQGTAANGLSTPTQTHPTLHATPLSGLSPTKHSPPRPSTSGSMTGNLSTSNGHSNGTPSASKNGHSSSGSISVMPPQHNLLPSPKLNSKSNNKSPSKSPPPHQLQLQKQGHKAGLLEGVVIEKK